MESANTVLLGMAVLLIGWIKLDVYHLVKRLDAHIVDHGAGDE